MYLYRRKFRSQTSDNMDRWKSRGPGGEDKKWEDQRRERERRKKMQVHEKVGKSRFTVFFQWLVALQGRKAGLLKRQVRSHLARWEMKNCTPLWREAHLEVKKLKTPHIRTAFGSWDVEKVWKSARRCGAKHISKKKMHKAHQRRTTFGSWDVEKVYAVVARSTFPSENVESTICSDHFWKSRCRKSARRCGAKHISKSKASKTDGLGPLLEVEMWKKCTLLWREAPIQVKRVKNRMVFDPFFDVQKNVHANELTNLPNLTN